MIQITDKILAVEVPDDASEIVIHNDPPKIVFSSKIQDPAQCGGDMICLPPGSYRFLFTTKTATEEDARKVVDSVDSEGRGPIFINYENGMYVFSTAKSSLRSLLRAKGCDQNKNYAVIQKTGSDE